MIIKKTRKINKNKTKTKTKSKIKQNLKLLRGGGNLPPNQPPPPPSLARLKTLVNSIKNPGTINLISKQNSEPIYEAIDQFYSSHPNRGNPEQLPLSYLRSLKPNPNLAPPVLLERKLKPLTAPPKPHLPESVLARTKRLATISRTLQSPSKLTVKRLQNLGTMTIKKLPSSNPRRSQSFMNKKRPAPKLPDTNAPKKH